MFTKLSFEFLWSSDRASRMYSIGAVFSFQALATLSAWGHPVRELTVIGAFHGLYVLLGEGSVDT
jgi:hypothetical protein